ncbi:hypothetical protein A1D31_37565 [Bradyrhizobium liaoningense]|nr:hypothetical protein A1D31_37565 [Bradyrhizobium liaoningense]
MDEQRIQILRELIGDQIEAVAAAVCEDASVLDAELYLRWLTREMVHASRGQIGFSDQSLAERMWHHYRQARAQRENI